jgi:hypothetical protein
MYYKRCGYTRMEKLPIEWYVDAVIKAGVVDDYPWWIFIDPSYTSTTVPISEHEFISEIISSMTFTITAETIYQIVQMVASKHIAIRFVKAFLSYMIPQMSNRYSKQLVGIGRTNRAENELLNLLKLIHYVNIHKPSSLDASYREILRRLIHDIYDKINANYINNFQCLEFNNAAKDWHQICINDPLPVHMIALMTGIRYIGLRIPKDIKIYLWRVIQAQLSPNTWKYETHR